jgi:hypothetical protein
VEALRLMGERPVSGDYVLGSGELRTTGDWVRAFLQEAGADEARHLRIDPALAHAVDPPRRSRDIRPPRPNWGGRRASISRTMVERNDRGRAVDCEAGSSIVKLGPEPIARKRVHLTHRAQEP